MYNPLFTRLAAAFVAIMPMATQAIAFDEKEDKKLVGAIMKAAKEGIAPEKIEASVGTKATINTSRGKMDVDILGYAAFSDDPAEKERLSKNFRKAKTVVYWVRPVEAKNPRMIGVLWMENGKSEVFYGVVLPPR